MLIATLLLVLLTTLWEASIEFRFVFSSWLQGLYFLGSAYYCSTSGGCSGEVHSWLPINQGNLSEESNKSLPAALSQPR